MDRTNSQSTPASSSTSKFCPGDKPHNQEVVEKHLVSQETSLLVRRKARRIITRAGLPSCHLDDTVQILYMALVRDGRTFDPAKGEWLPFAERSLQFASNNIARHDLAEKRDRRKSVSLHVMVKIDGEEGFTELEQLITQDEVENRTGTDTPDDISLRAKNAQIIQTNLARFIGTFP